MAAIKARRLVFICPRYEAVTAGGAEILAQRLAERLQKRGHRVEVFTTCARDHFTWKNFYEAGKRVINGVLVWRFKVNPNRLTDQFLRIQEKINRRIPIPLEEQRRWIKESVNSDEMYQFIKRHENDYDCFIFIPYLFGVTYFGSQIFPQKSILIPCLHDEAFAYLNIYKDLFEEVRGIMFNSHPEIQLAKRLFGISDEKISLVSMGFETNGEYDAERFRKKHGLKAPFILFAGRREGGKNTPLLIEYFRIYKKHNQNGLKLVLLGTGEVPLTSQDRKDILDFGYLDEPDKQDGYKAALAFCQPSVNESLSIVIMESWLAGRPVLAHGRCQVTRDHCLKSNGGLFFKDYPEFEECLNFFLDNPDLATRMGENGRRYAQENYSWDKVLDRFENALGKFGL